MDFNEWWTSKIQEWNSNRSIAEEAWNVARNTFAKERDFMRRRDVESELAYIQNKLNDIADRETMRSTTSGINPLKELAFRIGCCRAALDIKEDANLHLTTKAVCHVSGLESDGVTACVR